MPLSEIVSRAKGVYRTLVYSFSAAKSELQKLNIRLWMSKNGRFPEYLWSVWAGGIIVW